MAKDPNKDLDQKDKTSSDDNSKKSNKVTISADDWNKMQSNMKHMNNTVKNLSTKLEDAHKSNGNNNNSNSSPQSVSKKDNQPNGDDKSKPSYNDLLNKVNDLSNRVTSKDKHTKLVNYTKQKLNAKHMNVSKSTLSQLVDSDTGKINNNIKWFEPIYKRASQIHIQRKPHHSKKRVNIGAKLANNGSAPKSKPLSDYFK